MSVSSICNHNVATIDPDADIAEAAERMRKEHVGDLIVARFKEARLEPVGILTDRDIVVTVVARKVDPTTLTVGDVMSADLLTVREDNGIDFALREMRRVGVRRVPVVGSTGELVGVLSIDDVVDYLGAQLEHVGDIIRFGQHAEAEKRP
jgi:CBS domain-containing protein